MVCCVGEDASSSAEAVAIGGNIFSHPYPISECFAYGWAGDAVGDAAPSNRGPLNACLLDAQGLRRDCLTHVGSIFGPVRLPASICHFFI